jgi:hypothetical protein
MRGHVSKFESCVLVFQNHLLQLCELDESHSTSIRLSAGSLREKP